MTKDTGIVSIHGRDYETVASRVARFRSDFTFKYSIETLLVSRDESTVVMKAVIKDLSNDKVIATGYAEESRTSSSINRTSALENCETSAIGRALAAFGMAGTEYASADEVAQAIHQQNSAPAKDAWHPELKKKFDGPLLGPATDRQREIIKQNLDRRSIATEDQPGYLIENYGVELPLTKEGASAVIDDLFATSKDVVQHA